MSYGQFLAYPVVHPIRASYTKVLGLQDVVVQEGGMPVRHFPAVLGHEGMGIIRQVGSNVQDTSLQPGDAVLLSFQSCGQCNACLEGRCGTCPSTTLLNLLSTARADNSSPISLPDGTPVYGQFFGQSSLSKMAVVTENSIVKVTASELEFQYLAPLSCGYLTGAGTVLNVLRPNPGSKIAIVGMGAVGFAALLAAKATGVQSLIAVDIVNSKLSTAASLAASHTINTKFVGSLSKGILDIFPDGVDFILDTSGIISLMQDSVKALAHGGTLALVGVPSPASTIEVNALDILISCKRIVGVIGGAADPKKVCTVNDANFNTCTQRVAPFSNLPLFEIDDP